MDNLLKMRSADDSARYGRTRSRSKPAPTTKRSEAHCHIATVKDRSLAPDERFGQLVRQLIDSPKVINSTVKDGMTALHHAVLEGDEMCTKALIVFGADINALNHFDQTPLDIALENQSLHQALAPLLLSVGCECGSVVKGRRQELAASLYPSPQSQVVRAMAEEEPATPSGAAATDAACMQGLATVQPGEGEKTNQRDWVESSLEFSEKEGHRILSLDGGGVRGLIQIEVLSEIERTTGSKITEIFDWIIGTSTGAIIALLLVYKQKSVQKLRQTYFKLKDQVFSNGKMGGFAYNSEELEKLLKEEFGTELKMSDIKHPKVLIAAVSKASTQPKLHFFNNCFGDEFSTQPVWKVARYTSAAPMYFTEFENYVDGGVLANNPCDEGLIRIQSYYRHLGARIPISCVLSIGSGLYPARDLGRVDVHQFFSFGIHWFSRTDTLTARSSNLLRLLSNALLESEAVAERCRAHCTALNLPFHRINPHLTEEVMSGETDCHKIVDMLMQSKTWVHSYGYMDTLGPLLRRPLPFQSLCCSVLASLYCPPASI